MASANIETQLLHEPVGQLELSNYCIVTVDTTVREVVERMSLMRQNCALVVGKGTQLVGILTDRDVLRKIVTQPDTWDQAVAVVMTPSPITIPWDAPASDALRMMEQHQYRDIPVIGPRGSIRGNVTYYSILKFLTDHFPQAVYNLPPDPDNYAEARDGG